MHAIPGNPWSNYSSSPRMMLGLSIDKPVQRELNRRFGLDLPLWRQFTRYIIGDFDQDGSFFCGAVCGNLGPSIQQRGRSVQDVLFGPPEGHDILGEPVRVFHSPGPVWVIDCRWAGDSAGDSERSEAKIGVKPRDFGRPGGVDLDPEFCARLAGDHCAGILAEDHQCSTGLGLPEPLDRSGRRAGGHADGQHCQGDARLLDNILNEDYIRTARGKGLTQTRVMLVHVLRNALVPIITFLGPTLMEMFTGLFIVENLYSFPGFGREYWEAVLELDYPMIMGLTLIYATGIVLVNVLIEVMSATLDPRLRSSKPQGVA